MEGIRLRPGERRKSIKRKTKAKQQDNAFDNVDDMFTFAETGLRPEQHIFARKFSQLRYCNYKNQFNKSCETNNTSEDDDTSRGSFNHSASSRLSQRPASALIPKQADVINDGQSDTENKTNALLDVGSAIYSQRVKQEQPYIGDNQTERKAWQKQHEHDKAKIQNNDIFLQQFNESSTEVGNISKDTLESVADVGDECQIVELQVEGVRKASIKLPPLSFKTMGRRPTELNFVSRKQVRGAFGREDSFSTDGSAREPSFYRSELGSSLSSEVSLSFVRSDSISSDDGPRVLNISDSSEFDTDLENDAFGRADDIPDHDIHIGRTVYQRMCEELGKPPQKYILKSLAERTMTLRNRSLGKDGIAPLCAALKDNLRLERINLDGTDITDEGIEDVTNMLLENVTISHLSIANNSLGLKASQLISHVLVTTKYLSHLNLSGNTMKDDAAWHISSGMSSNNVLTHLDLGYNDFGEKGGIFISSGLVRNNKLVFLGLRWNKICGKGPVAIFQALMLNNTLEVLDFSWNGMGYDGAVAMSKCLKTNRRLRTLDVSNNRLAYSCCSLLAEGLRANSTLTQLKMACNPLSTSGCMDILEAVATEDSSISFLDCSEIPVLGEADLLAATVSRRRKFLFIHGGIVPTHDTVGLKHGRERDPMIRVIEYLRMLGLRPLELMKSFDKTSLFELPRQEFVSQIKKIGVKLHTFEIEALANSISGKGFNKNVINYRKLSMAVREVVHAERERKIKEREEWLQIKKQHENILKRTQLEIDSNSQARVLSDLDSLKVASFNASSLMATSRDSMASSKASGVGSIPAPVAVRSPLQTKNPLQRRVSFAVTTRKKPKKLIKRKSFVKKN